MLYDNIYVLQISFAHDMTHCICSSRNAIIDYSISAGNDRGDFRVVLSDGDLLVNTTLDFEIVTRYQLTVSCSGLIVGLFKLQAGIIFLP